MPWYKHTLPKRSLKPLVKVAKKELIKYYNADYLEYCPSVHAEDAPIKLRQITKFLPSKLESVSDVGCGLGIILKRVAEQSGAQMAIGIDISKTILRKTKSLCRNLELVCADGEYLPFKDNVFDLSLAIDVVEHVPNPSKLISEQFRIAKKMLAWIPIGGIGLWHRRKSWEQNVGHLHIFNKEKMLKLIKQSGFKVDIYEAMLPNNKMNEIFTQQLNTLKQHFSVSIFLWSLIAFYYNVLRYVIYKLSEDFCNFFFCLYLIVIASK